MKKRLLLSTFISLLVFLSSISPTFATPLEPVHVTPLRDVQHDKYQTNLFTGSATYNYPIKIPKGTDDLTPNVSLIYNHEATNDFSTQNGAGWEFNYDYIERDVNYTPGDTSDDKFRLHFQGQTYDLVYVSSDSRYHTKIESNLNIKKLTGASNDYSDYWQVITPNGTVYRFGNSKNS